ncbi:hypothetical protein SAMN04487895_11094 [Paenibacillus sophorae]|uniref:Helix-turn-helix domain-containing protein n=1 Tax=Paenibacillus sophorae TaxID=1333845 RepID=A0A1H8RTG7_9BACL|nr:helix-turn-helix domain-containing protein [Paenibacillus sophorae]QWU16987.1 helix-turn-helix domain-containing protein [Paenibacillus sophorae]SEO69645.1 hypothetical protein SAMN04487895_11094 [Paenibacillus sophorae]
MNETNEQHHEQEIFFKVGVLAIRKNGLLKRIDADGFTTLAAIASFMNEDGVCYPTQETLADIMGVTRQAANARVGRLLKILLDDGTPIIERSWKYTGTNKRAVYRVNFACGIRMGRSVMSATFDSDSQFELRTPASKGDFTLCNGSGQEEELKDLKEEPIQEEPVIPIKYSDDMFEDEWNKFINRFQK